MDYLEEQRSELEAIEAIYPNEYSLLADSPLTFIISVKSEKYDEDDGEGLACTMKFTLPQKYPEQVPEIEILTEDDENLPEEVEPITNLEPDDSMSLEKLLSQQAEENIGMAMIFTIVSAANEWLSSRWDTIIKEREEAAERKRIEDEEAEHQRFEGTRVNVQTFIAWKMGFDAEREAIKKKQQEKSKEKEVDNKKLTGKEMFLRDKSMIDSDLKFEEEDDAGPIDESLFEDMDDLDIGDSEEEEEN